MQTTSEFISIEKQIEILNDTKKYLIDTQSTSGICQALKTCIIIALSIPRYHYRGTECKYPFPHYAELEQYIPLFTINNARYFDPHINGEDTYDYWWQEDLLEPRIAFIDWILSQLNKESNGNSNNNTATN